MIRRPKARRIARDRTDGRPSSRRMDAAAPAFPNEAGPGEASGASQAEESEASLDGMPGKEPLTPIITLENPLPAGQAALQTMDEDEDDLDDTASMSLTEHLNELRKRIVKMLLGAAAGFLLCYSFAEKLFNYLALPLKRVMPEGTRLIYTSVPEGFFVYLKVAFVAGIFIASPYIFYQLWAFIAPGLYKNERRTALPLAFLSAVFFILGASFCYFSVFPFAFSFFMSYSRDAIIAMPSLNEYLGFSLKLLLAFGLIFEMPLFSFFLSRLGIITAAWMRRMRKYAVLGVFVVAAILTPPDVVSQLLMAGPMLILYELSIFVAAIAQKRPPKPVSASDSETIPSPETTEADQEKNEGNSAGTETSTNNGHGQAEKTANTGEENSAHNGEEPPMDNGADADAESAKPHGLCDDANDQPQEEP